MKRTKQEKAITLVALIITIIILLILAVVTIAAISGDGDLISHANNAKAKYTEESAKENTTVQGYLAKMPNSKLKEDTDEGSDNVPEELKKIIFGDDFTGKSDETLLEEFETQNISIIKYEEIQVNNSYGMKLYITYNDAIYYFTLEERETGEYNSSDEEPLTAFYSNSENGMKLVYEADFDNTNIGKYVSYGGIKWIILYNDSENGLQLISEKLFKYNDLKYGYNFDINPTKYHDYEEGVNAYNNAIVNLNRVCEEVVEKLNNINTSIIDVRCVGSNPKNKNEEPTTYYTSEILQRWDNEENSYDTNKKIYGAFKCGDKNYKYDIFRLAVLNQLGGKTDDNSTGNYWVASRNISEHYLDDEDYYDIEFQINYVDKDLCLDTNRITEAHVENTQLYSQRSNSVYDEYVYLRPVIKFTQDVELDGNGTYDSPYEIK